MRAQVNVITSIFVVKDLAVAGHEHGDRVRKQQHSGRERARHAVQARVANARILQIHRVHQVVQGYVRVAAAQPCGQWGEQSQKCVERISAECAEQQVEPDHVRLQAIQGF
jgi:hypothetical protein